MPALVQQARAAVAPDAEMAVMCIQIGCAKSPIILFALLIRRLIAGVAHAASRKRLRCERPRAFTCRQSPCQELAGHPAQES